VVYVEKTVEDAEGTTSVVRAMSEEFCIHGGGGGRRGLVAFHGEIEWGIGRFRVYGRGKRRGRGHAWPRRHACGRCHGPLASRPGERFAATEEGYKSVRSIYAQDHILAGRRIMRRKKVIEMVSSADYSGIAKRRTWN
jgi:hypothetical protein